MKKFTTAAAAAALIVASIAATAPAYAARTGSGIGSVVNCDASGHRQANGAVIGAVIGGIVGNNVSHSKGAPVVGAVTGAAAGSYIGCQQQRVNEERRGTGEFLATTNINIRQQPSTSGRKIGRVLQGEAVKVGSYTGNWAWVQPYNGPAGYVSSAYLVRR